MTAPQTPLNRVLERLELAGEKKAPLRALHASLNPVDLRGQIDKSLKEIGKMRRVES